MGLLSVGEPLSWTETKSYSEHVRERGIKQFINLYNLCKTKTNDVLKFGDEIEYMLVKFDHESRKVRVSNRAPELLKLLQEPEENGQECASLWRPEFGAYMIEGTPGHPYSMGSSTSFLIGETNGDDETNSNSNEHGNDKLISQMFSFVHVIEANMRLRRKQVQDLLDNDEAVLSISSFPLLGTFDFCTPTTFVHPTHGYGRSLFFPDESIYLEHPRFCTLANNIRERRGKNVQIYMPIYLDENTPKPFRENFVDALNIDRTKINESEIKSYEEVARKRQDDFRKDNQIYMDAMGFGMGCCCLQVTFQASNINEACSLYDQLAPLCPIMMALSAASPIFRGYLIDYDCRWSAIAQSVDDRTDAEINGGKNPKTGKTIKPISKSRFDSIDLYINENNVHFNDIDVVYDERYYKHLIENQIPASLAKHIAHLFIRDPLVIFKEKLNIDDSKESDHFENIQSTNWQTMRFKPPPLNQIEIGWRVEFRPMELQLTDTENAAFVIFTVLLTRMILSFNLDLLIPMSKVEENMKVAQKRDAARNGRFWFRRNICFPKNLCDHFVRKKSKSLKQQLSQCFSRVKEQPINADSCCVRMSINEIIHGTDEQSEGNFPGLLPLLNFYLDSIEIDAKTRCTLHHYLNFISMRAKGKIPTAAQIIRQFVLKHEQYKHDSRVTSAIQYDLLALLNQLQTDQITLQELIDIIQQKPPTTATSFINQQNGQ